jgi:hypothetical protein
MKHLNNFCIYSMSVTLNKQEHWFKVYRIDWSPLFWILDTCYDNSFMLMILASIYLQLHLYGPIVNKSHQKKEILIQTLKHLNNFCIYSMSVTLNKQEHWFKVYRIDWSPLYPLSCAEFHLLFRHIVFLFSKTKIIWPSNSFYCHHRTY